MDLTGGTPTFTQQPLKTMANFDSLKFKIRQHPELEAALNALGREVNRLKDGGRYFSTRHIKARTENGLVGFDLVFSTEGGLGAASTCILGDLIPIPDSDPLRYTLRAGYITGGGASFSVGLGAEVTASLEPTAGHHVWLKVDWTAVEADDVILPGGTMDGVTMSSGATIPDDALPEIGSLSGTHHVPLGFWPDEGGGVAGSWSKAGCGSLWVEFCQGGFSSGRASA